MDKKIEIIELLKTKIQISELLDIRIERLGGLTNQNFKVKTIEGDFVVRFPGVGTEEMINREEEYVSTNLAYKLGVDSELLYFDSSTGVKISRYIKDAETMKKEKFYADNENLKLVANLFNKLHTSGEKTTVIFNVFEKIEQYESILFERNFSLWRDYNIIRKKVLDLKEEVHKFNVELVPCHNDPLCENFIKSGNQMYLVDWEYAGMNDPMWDIADFIIETELAKEGEQQFIKYYLGEHYDEQMIRRININKVFLDFLWALWAMLRVVNGEGQAMLEWANERYTRAVININNLKKEKN